LRSASGGYDADMTKKRGPEGSKHGSEDKSKRPQSPEQGNPTDGTRLMGSVPSRVHEEEKPERTPPPGTERDRESE